MTAPRRGVAAALIAEVAQRLARLVRLQGAIVEGDDRARFVRASSSELVADPCLRPRLACRMVLRWNSRHCRPPLGREAVLELFEGEAARRLD